MKDDKFIELLHNKLKRVKVSPPDDVWAKIERSLGTLSDKEAGYKKDDIDKIDENRIVPPSPGIEIRRPYRRKIKLAYIAASIAACVMIIFVASKLDNTLEHDNRPVSDSRVLPANSTNHVDTLDHISSDSHPETGQKDTKPLTSPFAGSDTGSVIAVIDVVEIETDTEIIVVSNNDTTDNAEKIKTDNDDIDKDKDPFKAITKDTTSDTKRIGGSGVFTPVKAEYNRRTRRAIPVSTSLYAANIASGTGSKENDYGPPHYLTSNLPVKDADMAAILNTEPVKLTDIKHRLPISFGINVGIEVIDRLTVETGILYTYMHSEWTETGNQSKFNVKQKLHYVGVPLNLKYNFVDRRNFNVYIGAGGTIEKCVSGTQTYKPASTLNVGEIPEKLTLKPKGIQASLGGNIGIEWKLGKTVGLYAEPGVSYFFKNNQPASYRTENPLSFTFKLGLRVNL